MRISHLSASLLGVLLMLLPGFMVAKKITVQGTINNCETDSVFIYQLDGVSFQVFASTTTEPNGDSSNSANFTFENLKVSTGFYFIGPKPESARMVILGEEKEILLKGTCDQFRQASVSNSPINDQFVEMNLRSSSLQREFQQLVQAYRIAVQKKQGEEAVRDQLEAHDRLRLAYYDSVSKAQPFLGKVLGLSTYMSYQGLGNTDKYPSEGAYFAGEFFRFTPFQDKVYNGIPFIHDAFKTYTFTLTQVGLSTKAQRAELSLRLDSVPYPSSAHKLALMGSISGFNGKNNSLFIEFAKKYQSLYPEDKVIIAQLDKQMKPLLSKAVGAEAPDFVLPTPAGDTLALSDLRGKVVLIDFWASWCRPCRMENPNVVRLYHQYKDKGFDIIGVSLDRNKSAWTQAIQKDGLAWHHVSDLKYWKNKAAQAYGVSSIPYTVLVDQEGKILGTGLRGRALERKLNELFGETESETEKEADGK